MLSRVGDFNLLTHVQVEVAKMRYESNFWDLQQIKMELNFGIEFGHRPLNL